MSGPTCPATPKTPSTRTRSSDVPATGYYRDVAEMAAALFESLILNRPFAHGNRRVAFFATDVFLRMNGWKIPVKARKAHTFLIGLLEKGTSDLKHLLPRIRRPVVKL